MSGQTARALGARAVSAAGSPLTPNWCCLKRTPLFARALLSLSLLDAVGGVVDRFGRGSGRHHLRDLGDGGGLSLDLLLVLDYGVPDAAQDAQGKAADVGHCDLDVPKNEQTHDGGHDRLDLAWGVGAGVRGGGVGG